MGILRKNFQKDHPGLLLGRAFGGKRMPFSNDAHKQLGRVGNVHIQIFPLRALLTVALIASLCGCEQGQKSRRDVKAKQLSPEQSACLKRASTRQLELAEDFAKRQLEAMKEQRSTIELTLLERRMTEEACLEEAKCFGLGEPAHSVMFESCLSRVESEGVND